MKDVIAIGGSAGCLPVVRRILDALPEHFNYPVIVVIHRLRNVVSDLDQVLALSGKNLVVREPEDKEPVQKGVVYLAPQNYHLQIETDKTFSLDYSEPVNFSRPSIDVTFDCVASVYKNKSVGILLSGASRDGAAGIAKIIKKGGAGVAQDPSTAEYAYMPQSAIDTNENILVLSPEAITQFIKTNFTS